MTVDQAIVQYIAMHNTDTFRSQNSKRFNSYAYDGEKKVVLSTTSWLGGKNAFLGAAYLTLGALCFASAAVFAYFAMYPPRTLGDVAEFMNSRE